MKAHALLVIVSIFSFLQDSKAAQASRKGHRALRKGSLSAWLSADSKDLQDAWIAGEDIWNQSLPWATFGSSQQITHEGIVSNVYRGSLNWEESSYLSLRSLLAVTLVTYPVAGIFAILALTIAFGMCLNIKPEVVARLKNEEAVVGELPASALIQCGDLTANSQRLYFCWELFCRTLPSLFVFGSPLLLLVLNRHMPQEVITSLTVVTSFMLFMNGMHMVTYGGQGVKRLREAEGNLQAQEQRGASSKPLAEEVKHIVHWVILPQYKEDVEIISMTLRSIAQSSMAMNIGVLLAMEEREGAASQKAQALREEFGNQLGEVQACYHPANLPDDPPGKASNSAFAFHWLVQYLNLAAKFSEGDCRIELARQQVESCSTESGKRLGWQGHRPVVLTVADADSEFHSGYFEGLAWAYLEAGPAQQDLCIWQSPIFHVKNYAAQPAPVKVGSIFTGIHELASLSDPHGVKFPYSTYSFSLRLARSVGGWDPDWIAEDWHMGIKLYFPTCNYTPEDSTYMSTLYARWIQMKRHALGFSDFTYYFMMLPLVFSRASRVRSRNSWQQVCNMTLYGTAVLFKLVNVHVIVGLITGYNTMQGLLKVVMAVMMPEQRHMEYLFDWTHIFRTECGIAGFTCVAVAAGLFVSVYDVIKRAIDEPKETSRIVHWFKTLLYFSVGGIFFFYGVGIASWLAALNVLVSRSFKYEVALKPSLGAKGGYPGVEDAPEAAR